MPLISSAFSLRRDFSDIARGVLFRTADLPPNQIALKAQGPGGQDWILLLGSTACPSTWRQARRRPVDLAKACVHKAWSMHFTDQSFDRPFFQFPTPGARDA